MIHENTPPLETSRLILRKFTPDDSADMLPILRDAQVNTFLPWFPIKTLQEAEVFLHERYISHYEKPWSYCYAICEKETNRPVGYIGVSDNDSFDLGYGLAKEHWGKGYATEAGIAVVERLKAAGFTYITATHDVNNPKSGEVMKKIGMSYKYSYEELWQPKNYPVVFRMYQLNLDGNDKRTYTAYWNKYDKHFVEVTESDRLIFRKMSRSDFDDIAKMLCDAEVMYAWEHGFSDQETTAWIDKCLALYEKIGYNYFVAQDKKSGDVVGQIGLINELVNSEHFTGLGYILNKAYWGKGYATEGAKAMIDYAFTVLKKDKVIATIRPENTASVAVAERLGMVKTGELIKQYNGKDMVHFMFEKDMNLWSQKK